MGSLCRPFVSLYQLRLKRGIERSNDHVSLDQESKSVLIVHGLFVTYHQIHALYSTDFSFCGLDLEIYNTCCQVMEVVHE